MSTTTLAPMRAEVYEAWVTHMMQAYAAENVRAGEWPEEGALDHAAADTVKLLPQGLATPTARLFEILDADATTVGTLWVEFQQKPGRRDLFVYDVEVAPEHRRKGHATRAFHALHAFAIAEDVARIELHVFGHNPAAQELYRTLGYEVTSANMAKWLTA